MGSYMIAVWVLWVMTLVIMILQYRTLRESTRTLVDLQQKFLAIDTKYWHMKTERNMWRDRWKHGEDIRELLPYGEDDL